MSEPDPIVMAGYIDATREMAAWNAAQEALMAERIEAHQRRWEAAWNDAVTMVRRCCDVGFGESSCG